MSLQLLELVWFTNAKGVVGVALFKDGLMGNKKAYISSVDGNDQEHDIQFIVAYSTRGS